VFISVPQAKKEERLQLLQKKKVCTYPAAEPQVRHFYDTGVCTACCTAGREVQHGKAKASHLPLMQLKIAGLQLDRGMPFGVKQAAGVGLAPCLSLACLLPGMLHSWCSRHAIRTGLCQRKAKP
jgi:hypothetical protein